MVDAPEIPEEVQYGQLDRTVRARLRTLSKDNAEDVGRHLIMVGSFLDLDPELAYRHAQVAVARGGRVDVVREANALAAYATGRYAEALREFRTVRRLNGSHEHLPLMADCERGLGRPERAIDLARSEEAKSLPAHARAELDIVLAGARLDMGDAGAALVLLRQLKATDEDQRVRIGEATVPVLRAMGKDDEAEALEATLPSGEAEPDLDFDITVYDVAELDAPVEDVEDVEDVDDVDGDAGSEPTDAVDGEPAVDSAAGDAEHGPASDTAEADTEEAEPADTGAEEDRQ
ncbi:hypothetical protein [Demequina sp. NBRC 110056]|uniref:hypothetical protein n=1 Tax=Demequina sp. NBRC 110056 TaxID=1570345 RepID=UPI000A00AFD8|nr:hypothetical protein [Demequina sp. NBRC 110056]